MESKKYYMQLLVIGGIGIITAMVLILTGGSPVDARDILLIMICCIMMGLGMDADIAADAEQDDACEDIAEQYERILAERDAEEAMIAAAREREWKEGGYHV